MLLYPLAPLPVLQLRLPRYKYHVLSLLPISSPERAPTTTVASGISPLLSSIFECMVYTHTYSTHFTKLPRLDSFSNSALLSSPQYKRNPYVLSSPLLRKKVEICSPVAPPPPLPRSRNPSGDAHGQPGERRHQKPRECTKFDQQKNPRRFLDLILRRRARRRDTWPQIRAIPCAIQSLSSWSGALYCVDDITIAHFLLPSRPRPGLV
jgi:hypothetical protein